ncbi:SDR family oxidoreductase [Proteobacteria bacterium 005FR1]|nr:SDR family oxidoreductase [Proteobacteria bacterium 005FR1]
MSVSRKLTYALVTGGTGFIGRALVARLRQTDIAPRLALRQASTEAPDASVLGDFDATTDWTVALNGVEAVVHCAGRAHVLKESSSDPLQSFRETNTVATLRLASQAAEQGVKRFVFLSSIGVNGELTRDKPFEATDTPAPRSPYAISKLEAEEGLWDIQRRTGMEVVVIRPPLVYGPGAPGNFGLLARAIDSGIPLPLARIDNMRSFVSVGNLADLIINCVKNPRAAGQLFLVRDGHDISTSELAMLIGRAQGRPAKLFWLPPRVLRLAALCTGKSQAFDRLFGSLRVDDSATRDRLGWAPPLKFLEGFLDQVDPPDAPPGKPAN